MAYTKGLDRYKKVDVNTASQGRLVVMLYEGAIKFLETTLPLFRQKHNLEEIHNNLVKAQDIISELLVSLNYDAGDVAHRLAAIYSYMNKRLLEANVQKKVEPVNEVLGYLRELREAWDRIADQTPAPKTPQQRKSNATKGGNLNVAG